MEWKKKQNAKFVEVKFLKKKEKEYQRNPQSVKRLLKSSIDAHFPGRKNSKSGKLTR